VADPRSGVDDEGRWVPAFPGQRKPTSVGNTLAQKHGCYGSTLTLSVRADALADEVRGACPAYSPSDEHAVRLCGAHLARFERAMAALDEVDERLEGKRLAGYLAGDADRLDRLRRDARSWANAATKLLEALGCTTAARFRMGLDAALTHKALTVADLHSVEEG
jgi:hypothetical protein